MTPAQEIAKLKSEVERLRGEVAGLKYAVAVQPHQYVPVPAPRPYPYITPMPLPNGPHWTAKANCSQSLSPDQVRLQQSQVMN